MDSAFSRPDVRLLCRCPGICLPAFLPAFLPRTACVPALRNSFLRLTAVCRLRTVPFFPKVRSLCPRSFCPGFRSFSWPLRCSCCRNSPCSQTARSPCSRSCRRTFCPGFRSFFCHGFHSFCLLRRRTGPFCRNRMTVFPRNGRSPFLHCSSSRSFRSFSFPMNRSLRGLRCRNVHSFRAFQTHLMMSTLCWKSLAFSA